MQLEKLHDFEAGTLYIYKVRAAAIISAGVVGSP